MTRILALLALVLLLGALGIGLGTGHGLTTPADSDAPERVFEVASGEALSQVARRLRDAGLLRETPLFGPRTLVLFARARGVDRQVKSGEYDLSPAATPVEILAKLVAGEVKTHLVTIPPGLHAREVALRLEDAGITEGARFVALAFDPEFTHELGVRAASLEGYLLPESYRFRRDTPADEVLRTMVEHFHAAWNDDDRARLAEFRFSLHELVTLASIVEKETGVAEERARIAAVFDNRLQRRMRLQSDPTVIYGIIHETGEFDGNIRRRDLETDTPYNTYTRGGFPPGPIANPSMEAIRAVLEPEDSPYLYFVAKNDGTHFFSSRLKDHNNAVNRYQRRRSPANGN